MIDVRERDLRFTAEETRAVLQRLAGIKIDDDLLAHIHSELEGWIVGLRLVCLALRNRETPELFLRGLSGGTSTMQDYLAGEVLSLQPETFRCCLLSLAILDRFCAPLCEAVCEHGSGSDGSTPFLSKLIEANLFTIELLTWQIVTAVNLSSLETLLPCHKPCMRAQIKSVCICH